MLWPALEKALSVSPQCLRFVQGMFQAAQEYRVNMGLAPHTAELTFFVPQYVIARHFDLSEKSLWRYFQKYPLIKHVLTYKAHYTTYRGKTIMDGCLWSVRLSPSLERLASIPLDILKRTQRDLDLDREDGYLSESFTVGSKPLWEVLSDWASRVGLRFCQEEVSTVNDSDTLQTQEQRDFWNRATPPRERLKDAVTRAFDSVHNISGSATELCNLLGSTHFKLWCKILHRLRGSKKACNDILTLVEDVYNDAREHSAKNAGKVLYYRLRKLGMYEVS
jgi:hypothetical protein